jgi:hypothetical protein
MAGRFQGKFYLPVNLAMRFALDIGLPRAELLAVWALRFDVIFPSGDASVFVFSLKSTGFRQYATMRRLIDVIPSSHSNATRGS